MSVSDAFANPEVIEQPYDYYDLLRRQEEIFYSDLLQAYFVTRQADAEQIMNNPHVFSSRPLASTHSMTTFMNRYHPIYERAGTHPPIETLVTTDGDVHRRYRSSVDKAFGPAAVRQLEPVIKQVVDELIDQFIDLGQVDIYNEFCLKLPLIIMCLMVGLPKEDALFLKQSADASVNLALAAFETEQRRIELHEQQCRLHLYFQQYLDRYRTTPRDNLISKLIHLVPDGGMPFTDQELMSLLTVINVGGNETTTNGLGSALSLCFANTELQEYLRAHPQDIAKFVEEALRFESPVATMPRWVKEDIVVGNTHLPAGSMVQISFAAINRDPDAFSCPAYFDIDRSCRHMAFGKGPHFCLGARLARAELTIALQCILERMGNIRIDNDNEPLAHEPKLIVRALKKLPIAFTKL